MFSFFVPENNSKIPLSHTFLFKKGVTLEHLEITNADNHRNHLQPLDLNHIVKKAQLLLKKDFTFSLLDMLKKIFIYNQVFIGISLQ